MLGFLLEIFKMNKETKSNEFVIFFFIFQNFLYVYVCTCM